MGPGGRRAPVGAAGSLARVGRTYAELPGPMTLMTGYEKHGPNATSALDMLWVLYDQVLRIGLDGLHG